MTKTETIATFPKTFALSGFPDQEFSINESASYEAPFGSGNFMLYVFNAKGEAFCKGTPDELRREIR